MSEPLRLLLLAGTREARLLAARLKDDGRLDITASLAGVTSQPASLGVKTRSGGFGGVDGLVDYLRDHAINAMIDATHPFAATMTRHATQACAVAGTRMLRLQRPAWRPLPEDDWRMVPDAAEAAAALPAGARAFLAIGKTDLAAFARREDVSFTMRMIDPPEPEATLPGGKILWGPPGTTVSDEEALLRAHKISVLVAKNSGGKAGAAKLAAARNLGLRVVMIDRPEPPAVETVANVDEACSWIARLAEG